MAAQWFYQVAGTIVGPISSVELRNLAQRGRISLDTLVKNSPDAAWIPAARVQGLFPVSNESPPPITVAVSTPASQATPSVAKGTTDEWQTKQSHRRILILASIGAGTGGLSLVTAMAIAIGVLRSNPGEPTRPLSPPSSKIAATATEVISEKVKARRLTIVDENGKRRAELAVQKNCPTLTLYDENDEIRGQLGCAKDGASLLLGDENGKTRASLAMTKEGSCLTLCDGKRKTTVMDDRIRLFDSNGKPRAMLAALEDSTPGLVLFDENGKIGVLLSMKKDGSCGISLSDENGTVRGELHVKKDQGAILSLFDEKGGLQASLLGMPKDGGRLLLLDKNGRVVNRLP